MGRLDGILGNVLGNVLEGDRAQTAQNPLGSVLSSLGAGDQAQLLPELIDQLTPKGQLPEDQDSLIAKGLVMLRGVTAG